MLSRNQSESGASAILVAASLILLMGMAAVAIDLGAGFNERRQDQTAADLAALSAAVERSQGASFQDATTAAILNIDANLRSGLDWASCTDSDALLRTAAALSLTPATQCISFDPPSGEVRVKIPDQDTETTFARILGTVNLTTWADANALGISVKSVAGTAPFAVLDGAAAGEQVCLRVSSHSGLPQQWEGNGPGAGPLNAPTQTGGPDPCDEAAFDPDSQFFGTLDPNVYYDSAGTEICKSNELAYNIARGMDHAVYEFEPDFTGVGLPGTPATGFFEEGADCPGSGSVYDGTGRNTFRLLTGLVSGDLRCGMVSSRSGGCQNVVPGPGGLSSPARMHQGDHVQTTHRFLDERMDNAPLWQFFVDPMPVGFPASCTLLKTEIDSPTGTWDFYDKVDALRACLVAWNPSDGQLFDDEIATTPRMTFLPLLYQNSMNTAAAKGPLPCPASASNQCVHINSYVPVYLQTFYSRFNGGTNRLGCDPGGSSVRWGLHHAGQQQSCGVANDEMDMLSAIVLDCRMLSGELCEGLNPGNPKNNGRPAPEIQLTR